MSFNKKRVCVIGYPVKHSRSPKLHGFWIKRHQIKACYQAESIDRERLPSFVEGLRSNQGAETAYCGGNVTIPHKEEMVELVDILTPEAKSLSAVNTFWFDGHVLYGGNTDVYGFLTNLDESAPDWDQGKDKIAVVLGAGGAARAIIYGLIQRGFSQILLANRTKSRAEQLVDSFADITFCHNAKIDVVSLAQAEASLAGAQILVNTTSLGLAGQPPLRLSLANLSSDTLVSDIVYTPLKTDLLARAEARGNKIVDGLGMLLHQAVPGFEKWFGVRPSVTDDLRAFMLQGL